MLDKAYKTFFPFVGQETHEEKRKSLQKEFQDDLVSYLEYQKSTGENNKSAFDQSPNANKFCKHLYDSGYVKPQNNYRVVQDNNPVKSAVIT